MEARILLGGRTQRVVDRDLGPSAQRRSGFVSGELRWPAGRRVRRFGAVDLPTQSDKTYLLYAQPPSFGPSSKSPWSMATGRSPRSETTYTLTRRCS
jgi:hypothetical protein